VTTAHITGVDFYNTPHLTELLIVWRISLLSRQLGKVLSFVVFKGRLLCYAIFVHYWSLPNLITHDVFNYYNYLKLTYTFEAFYLTRKWLFGQFDCCGVESYTDFEGKGTWKSSAGDGTVRLAPVACCKTLPTTSTGLQECAGDTTATNYDTIAEIATKSNYNTVSE